MSDDTTTVAELRGLMARFVDERDWRQFHDAKNLSMSIAIEAAELMEHFQWVRSDALHTVADDAVQRAALSEEIADVGCYLLALCSALNIDLSAAISAKMAKNAVKYPAEEFRGKYRRD
ncbi:MAG: nucleotide pyrophosphohydrolase [Phycisphaerales bacterium]|nr:nucleotide pyrophosphohydrolase [Phycisphaerales bacterium]